MLANRFSGNKKDIKQKYKEGELYDTKEKAITEMKRRKTMYIEDTENDFTYMENESSQNFIVFADELSKTGDDREGEFHICVAELEVE